MTTEAEEFKRQEQRFEDLSIKFSQFFWGKIPYLQIEQDWDEGKFVAIAYLQARRDEQKIIIMKSCNPDSETPADTIGEALKSLNDRLEARLNGKVE